MLRARGRALLADQFAHVERDWAVVFDGAFAFRFCSAILSVRQPNIAIS
jgi:hypothetical protein